MGGMKTQPPELKKFMDKKLSGKNTFLVLEEEHLCSESTGSTSCVWLES